MTTPSRYAAYAPALFVFLWSTGFVGAKFGLPHAEPLTFLCWRFVVVLGLLVMIVPLSGEPAKIRLATTAIDASAAAPTWTPTAVATTVLL